MSDPLCTKWWSRNDTYLLLCLRSKLCCFLVYI